MIGFKNPELPKRVDTLLPPAGGGPDMVVAVLGVLLPLALVPEGHGLPVLDVVVAGWLLEYVRPTIASQVPVTNSGHQVPDWST